MKNLPIIFFALLVLSVSCNESEPTEMSDSEIATRQVIVDQDSFDQAWSSLQSLAPDSDPFDLVDLRNDSTLLIIDVAYGGGCEQHTFELIWPEVITMIYPPRYTVILNHDAHDDNCEAYLSSTLYFDLNETDLGLTPDIMNVIDLTIINGSNGDDVLKLND